jgi:hypothetical protein
VVADAVPVPNDIYLLIDRSGSMNCPSADDACETPPIPVAHPTRWEAVTTGVNAFVNAPTSDGIGVGLGFFSLSSTGLCDTATAYSTPAIPIAVLPGNALAVSNSIAATMPIGNTPTSPALQGAVLYAQKYVKDTPARYAAIVLVTDGLPNGCNSTLAATSAVAQAAFAATPSIKTYVVGLGATANLDQIALVGSGGESHYIPAAGDIAGVVTDALGKVAHASNCAYTIPTGVDPNLVNVEIDTGAMVTRIGRVVDASDGGPACPAQGGWYYDRDSSANPTRIVLCRSSCDVVERSPDASAPPMTGSVKILIGCP